MPDGFGGFMTPILAAFDPDGRHTDKLTGKDDGTPNADGPPSPAATPNAAGPDPGGYYEETVWGSKTWHSTNGSGDLHGQAAVDKADQVFGGPPTDGITGEKGYYGDWNPSTPNAD